jgi:asparagine N-glycosylation enzyme membrane subunit Stt3
MSSKHMGHIYAGKIPFYYLVLLIFFILLLFSVVTVLGFFVALAVGVVSVGVMLVRWLAHWKKIRSKRFEDDGRTIVLSEDEYKVIDKKS